MPTPSKQQWLLEHLLIPAGILPPALTYRDLSYNENLRKEIGNVGFEYFFILDQNPDKINISSIGGKIKTIHSPWPEFEHHSVSNPLLHFLANLFIFHGKKTNANFEEMAKHSFNFAQKISAKLATFHIEFLNHEKIPENLGILHQLEKETGIVPAIEHDGAYMDELVRRGRKYHYVDGSLSWMQNPVELIKQLDNFYPEKKFDICLDSAAMVGCSLPIVETTKKVLGRIAHVHLAGSKVGVDLASEIDSPEIAKIPGLLFDNGYQGYITAEVNGTVGSEEQRVALWHGMLSVMGINFLKDRVAHTAQRHIRNSCEYLLKFQS